MSEASEQQRLFEALGWNPRPAEPASRNIRVNEFPAVLVAVVGEERLTSAPTVKVREEGTGYLDGCFHPAMMPPCGMVKAYDQHGRVSFTFAVKNPRWKELTVDEDYRNVKEQVLFTIFQRYTNSQHQPVDQLSWNHRGGDFIPTRDKRLRVSCEMTHDKYAAISEVFAGTHPDLQLAHA